MLCSTWQLAKHLQVHYLYVILRTPRCSRLGKGYPDFTAETLRKVGYFAQNHKATNSSTQTERHVSQHVSLGSFHHTRHSCYLFIVGAQNWCSCEKSINQLCSRHHTEHRSSQQTRHKGKQSALAHSILEKPRGMPETEIVEFSITPYTSLKRRCSAGQGKCSEEE